MRLLPLKITSPWLICIVEQIHRAAFVLPTFAKRELEAYCAPTESVSSLQIVTSDISPLAFGMFFFPTVFKNILQANSYGENLCTI